MIIYFERRRTPKTRGLRVARGSAAGWGFGEVTINLAEMGEVQSDVLVYVYVNFTPLVYKKY